MPPTRRDQDVTIPAPGRRRWRCGQPARPAGPGPAIPRAVLEWPVGAGMTFLEHALRAAGKCQSTSLLFSYKDLLPAHVGPDNSW